MVVLGLGWCFIHLGVRTNLLRISDILEAQVIVFGAKQGARGGCWMCCKGGKGQVK
jgi:hypothetical protein